MGHLDDFDHTEQFSNSCHFWATSLVLQPPPQSETSDFSYLRIKLQAFSKRLQYCIKILLYCVISHERNALICQAIFANYIIISYIMELR